LRSLARRGIGAEALREFTLSFGLSLADIEVPAESLYSINRARIDSSSARRSFAADPIRVEVSGAPPELGSVSLPNHPDRPEMGRRTVVAGPSFFLPGADVRRLAGTEVRLKDLMNVALGPLPPDGGPVTARFLGTENRRIPRLQWVGVKGAVPTEVLQPDGTWQGGLAEASLATAHSGEIFQFERYGFVRVEDGQLLGATPVRLCYGHP
jgi:glutamyl-tRNA synthetase